VTACEVAAYKDRAGARHACIAYAYAHAEHIAYACTCVCIHSACMHKKYAVWMPLAMDCSLLMITLVSSSQGQPCNVNIHDEEAAARLEPYISLALFEKQEC
jgi:hypothetical protein